MNHLIEMPLEPQPPPSPVGKPTPPPKHLCSPSTPCMILLSEVGKRFHAFPKGSFKAQFAPPVIPRHVLQYLVKSPPPPPGHGPPGLAQRLVSHSEYPQSLLQVVGTAQGRPSGSYQSFMRSRPS